MYYISIIIIIIIVIIIVIIIIRIIFTQTTPRVVDDYVFIFWVKVYW